MIKHYRAMALIASCTSFSLSALVYTEAHSSLVIAANLTIMIISAYMIVRTLDSIFGFKQ